MKQIQLAYGSEGINFAFDENRFEVLSPASEAPLSDAGIGEALDASIESPPLADLLSPGESVLIVVSDATRATASAQIVHLLLRRIMQQGMRPVISQSSLPTEFIGRRRCWRSSSC